MKKFILGALILLIVSDWFDGLKKNVHKGVKVLEGVDGGLKETADPTPTPTEQKK